MCDTIPQLRLTGRSPVHAEFDIGVGLPLGSQMSVEYNHNQQRKAKIRVDSDGAGNTITGRAGIGSNGRS
jgi:hypothetical protein